MRSLKALIPMLVFSMSLVLTAGTASGADISGTISSTLTITEDSQLVGDVTCTVTAAPCISFGSSGITLKLHGFSITGRADSVTGCGGTSVGREVGILVDRVRGAVIQGPGIVQRFRNHGVQIGTRAGGSTRVLVTLVTASTNCLSGFIVFGPSSDNELEANISVRNGNGGAPCGGI